jgi:hypothetical protein
MQSQASFSDTNNFNKSGLGCVYTFHFCGAFSSCGFVVILRELHDIQHYDTQHGGVVFSINDTEDNRRLS